VHIVQVKDLPALQDFHGVEAVAYDHDYEGLPVDPIETLTPLLAGDHPAGQTQDLYVGYLDGTPVASLTVTMWTLDNLTSASVEGRVHPAYRRQGLGRELMDHALDVVRSAGRTRVFFEAHWLTSGEEGPSFPLLRSVGARPVLDDYRRVLDVREHPIGEPAQVPEGYRIVQWTDHAPDELVDGLAYLLYRMVLDAPMGEMDYEPESWDAARYRDTEREALKRGRWRFATAVVHEESGAVAGETELVVNRSQPVVSHQWNTIVDPEHRGRGLGLVLKTWNHRAVVDACPDVRWVLTWNAASNSVMIAVNEAMGSRVREKWTEWQLDL
jgi:GNAT superfamily N-acetyltransferase